MPNWIIREWQSGDAPSADHLNEPLSTVRTVRSITGDGNVEVAQLDSGTTISIPDRGDYVSHFICLIQSKGPKNENDYTDARYWCQIAQIVGGSTYDAIQANALTAPPTPALSPNWKSGGAGSVSSTDKAYPDTITATNISELSATANGTGGTKNPGGTHGLKTDGTQLVHVFGFLDGQATPTTRYVFTSGGTGGVLLRVTATTWSDGTTVLGQGWYRARIVTGDTSTADPTAAASESTIYTNGTTDVLLLNRLEIGLTKRLIDPSGSTVVYECTQEKAITTSGTFKGVAVFSTDGLQPKVCSNGA